MDADFQTFITNERRKNAARQAVAARLASRGSVRFGHEDGRRRALAGPDMAEPGMFRLTYLDEHGPSGHTTYNTFEEAIIDALRSKYEPVRTPYPWCRDPDACAGKGYCTRNPNCGE